MGLVELYEDDRYKVTCTTTYEANRHFFGNTSWCTASDRFGRYDGWIYFLEYVFDLTSGDVEDEYENLLTDYTVEAILVQVLDKTNNETYQIQLMADCEAGQICDSKDTPTDLTLPKAISAVFKSRISDLIDLTSKCVSKEYKYQLTKDEYVKKKRERVQRELEEVETRLNGECNDYAAQKREFIQKKASTVFESNLLENPEFIKKLVTSDVFSYTEDKNYTDEELLQFEEILKSQGYLYVDETYSMNSNIVAFRIMPVFGMLKDVDIWTPNGYPRIKNVFAPDTWWDSFDMTGQNAVVFAVVSRSSNSDDDIRLDKNLEIKSIVKVIKNNNNGTTVDVYNLHERGSLFYAQNDYRDNFLLITENSRSEDGTESSKSSVFCQYNFQTIELTCSGNRNICYDSYILFYDMKGRGTLLNLKSYKAYHFLLKEIGASSTLATKYCGYWFFGAKNGKGEGYLFCNDIVPLGFSINNIHSYYSACRLINNEIIIAFSDIKDENPIYYNTEKKEFEDN